MGNYPVPVKITHTPTKTTSITVRLNNGEIEQGIEALRAFCSTVMQGLDSATNQNAIADAMLKSWNKGGK
jgi:hypothetical protein